MSDFDHYLHFIAFAIKHGDVCWQDIPKGGGYKYYYAEMRLYVILSPNGSIYFSSAKNPKEALKEVLQ